MTDVLEPNDPHWKILLKNGNEQKLYDYAKKYYDKWSKEGMAGRDAMPVVSLKELDNGITEKVVVYFNWVSHNIVNDYFRDHVEKAKVDYAKMGWNPEEANILECGKLQYLWTDKTGDTISCVYIKACWGLDIRLCWETCHPEFRALTLEEIKANAMEYFKDKKAYEQKHSHLFD